MDFLASDRLIAPNHLKNWYSKITEANQWKLSVSAVDMGKTKEDSEI